MESKSVYSWPSALVKATSQQFHDSMITYNYGIPHLKNWKQLVISKYALSCPDKLKCTQ